MILRAICKAKIHHAVVTEANVEYIGSIAIDSELLERVDIVPGEKVAVWIETYALPAPAGSGSMIVNGAAAHHFSPGDKIIVVSFVLTDEKIAPRMILVDDHNRFLEDLKDNRRPDYTTHQLTAAAEV
jgi:aspartate 1-decarboxylase